GRSRAAAKYVGKSGLLDMVKKAMELSEGTFREEVLDVVANDDRGIVLVVQRCERDGRAIEYRTAHQWWIRGGTFSAWRGHRGDPRQFDEAWSGRLLAPGRRRAVAGATRDHDGRSLTATHRAAPARPAGRLSRAPR